MNTFFAIGLGMWEVIAIMLVVLLMFGAKKLPELAKGLGTGIKEFKKASRDITDDFQRTIEDEPPPAPKKIAPATTPTTPAAEENKLPPTTTV